MSVKKTFFGSITAIGLALVVILPRGADHPLGPQMVVAAAKSCPDIVKTALQSVDNRCSGTGRNSLCYGNVHVQVTPQPNAPKFTFAKPGDKTQLQYIQSLQLSSLSADANDWGVAEMRLQANLPDSAPGQSVTMLLFGNVQMSDGTKTTTYPTEEPTIFLSPPAPLPSVTPTRVAHATSIPKATLGPTNIPAPTSTAQTTVALAFKSMQAFYFSSGVGEPACNEAPEDGILIQSPKNGPKITLMIDDAKVVLGSTVFFQAQASGELIISTLDGSAVVSAFGQVAIAGAGSRVRVPLDANLRASGPPTQPEPYDMTVMKALPAQHLPLKVTPATPVPTLAPGQSYTTWRFTSSTQAVTGPCLAGSGSTSYATYVVDADGTVELGKNVSRSGDTYVLDQNYPAANNNTVHYRAEIHLTSALHGDGMISVVQAKSPFCRWTWAIRLDQISPLASPLVATSAP